MQALVWDRALLHPVNLVADHSDFKNNGVTKMLFLEQGSLPQGDIPEIVLFMCRPVLESVEHVASFIQKEPKNIRRRKFHILFVPHSSLLCEKWLDVSLKIATILLDYVD